MHLCGTCNDQEVAECWCLYHLDLSICDSAVHMLFLSLFGSLASQGACDVWKESGDMSDGGSSTTSGHWSGGSGISTPSPPHSEASSKYSNEAFSSPRADDSFETDSDPLLFDEPAPRKRKVWNTGQELTYCI